MSLYDKYGIYKIQNLQTGSVYIGKTTVSFGDRRDSHFASLRNGYNTNPNLQRDWDTYGEENFEFSIVHDCSGECDIHTINNLEVDYVKKYRELGVCYNIADGGDSGLKGHVLSDETKRKIGDKNRINMSGKKMSDSTRRKMSDAHKKICENWSDDDRLAFSKRMSEINTGRRWDDERRQRFSDMQKAKPNAAKYDVDVVRQIRNMHENQGLTISQISDELGINRKTVYNIATYRRWKNV